MYNISKTFEFCYGHRVHTQVLNGDYADDLKCACRHLHGHEGKLQVFMSSDTLDDTGMVTDFRHLEWLKRFINTIIDHRFIIDKNDPLFSKITTRKMDDVNTQNIWVPDTSELAGYEFTNNGETLHDWEHIESFFVVDFVPTSENLSKWMYKLVQAKMANLGVKITRVDWWETPKSCSSYQEE